MDASLDVYDVESEDVLIGDTGNKHPSCYALQSVLRKLPLSL
jgi:hypothetical protein